MRNLAIAVGLVSLGLVDSAYSQERRCEESKTPTRLPAAGALLDSARAVADLAAQQLPATGLRFSLVYTDEDSLPQIRALDSANAAATDLLAKTLLPRQPTGYWGVRVRVVGGPAPALTLERSRYCPPLAATIQARPRQVVATIRVGDRVRPVGWTVRIIADAEISETGRVSEIAMLRPSGVREIDEEILYNVRIRRFLPALLDETPVPSRLRVEGRSEKLWERVLENGLEAGFAITMVP